MTIKTWFYRLFAVFGPQTNSPSDDNDATDANMNEIYSDQVKKTIRGYFITTVLSIALAIVSITYNAWRIMESETNANIRSAVFEVLLTVAEFQEVIYAAHFDKLEVEGSPRRGWVKVRLIEDMSLLIGEDVASEAANLRKSWQKHWPTIDSNREAVDDLVSQIDEIRKLLRERLGSLS